MSSTRRVPGTVTPPVCEYSRIPHAGHGGAVSGRPPAVTVRGGAGAGQRPVGHLTHGGRALRISGAPGEPSGGL
ncbi:hypothetical protein GS506_20260 [Rhodococcus hoagii]|nr:hypothetical protein [Prescottella equi]